MGFSFRYQTLWVWLLCLTADTHTTPFLFCYVIYPPLDLIQKRNRIMFPLHGTARYGSLRFTFGGFSTGYSTWYFSVPPRLRFQANRTVTKTWRVNSADPWLAGENRRTCDTRPNRPILLDLNPHSQWSIECNCFERAHLFFRFLWSVEEVQMFLSLITEEQIQRELDGVFKESQQQL